MIRQLNAVDAHLYRDARLDALRREPQAFVSAFESETQKAELFLERCLKMDDALNIVFGAFWDERLVGIAGFVEEQAEVIQLYVDQYYRGHGIGRALLTTAVDEAFNRFDDLGVIQIAVLLTPKNAAELYQSVGFVAYKQEPLVTKNGFLYDTMFLEISRTIWKSLKNQLAPTGKNRKV